MITVLMPVYNAEKYLREAIESILNQTFKDFEFLIIDDGSTDQSLSIIHSYTDPRIRLVQNEKNAGITYTLNRGIHLATHELIARMDADDISHPQRLEKQYQYLQQHPEASVIASWVSIIKSDGEFQKISGHDPANYYYTLLFSPGGIYHPTVLYKKSAVLEVGLYSKEYAEDYNLWCKLVKKFKLSIIPEPLLEYRSSETSLWRVTKKSEYEAAHDEQIIDNVSFYTKNTCQLTSYEARFLRGNMAQVIAFNNKEQIVDCFRKLDYTTTCFLANKNVNNTNSQQARQAALLYKRKLLKKLAGYKKPHEMIELMLRLRYWLFLSVYVRNIIAKKLSQRWQDSSGFNGLKALRFWN